MKDYNFFNRADNFEMRDSYRSVKDDLVSNYSNLGIEDRLYNPSKSVSGNLGYD